MENRKPLVCLLGASFGTNNLGVNALTSGTLKAFFTQYPDGEIYLLDYGKKGGTYHFRAGDRTIPVQLVNIRFSKKFYLKNNVAFLIALALLARIIPFQQIRKQIIFRNYWLRRVTDADIIVSLAGGDSFSDIYGLGRLLYVSCPQILALVLGKKLVLLPQTIGPFKGIVAKIIAKAIMRRASLIYSRDRAGLDQVRNLLAAKNTPDKVRFCYDVGFVLDPVKPGAMDLDGLTTEQGHRKFPVVGLNVSGLLYMGGYSLNNMFGLCVDYRQLVLDIIAHLILKKKAIVLLVPHVFGTRENPESDSGVCELIYSELKQRYQNKIFMARGNYHQGEIKYIIGTCDLFIGSRMHACIAALSQNIPTVGLSYSKKFLGVWETVSMGNYIADPRVMDHSAIIEVIDKAFESRQRIRWQLEQKMPEVKAKVLNLFDEILDEALQAEHGS